VRSSDGTWSVCTLASDVTHASDAMIAHSALDRTDANAVGIFLDTYVNVLAIRYTLRE
jgi:hypothetical protein